MKAKMFFSILVMALLIGCEQNNPPDNQENLKKVLFDYFEGIKTRDLNKMNKATTDDFILFEDGKVWNNDSIIAEANSFSNYSAEYTFENFKINIDNNTGSMSYFNHGVFTLNDTAKVSYNWLESAIFKKVDGNWKINFLHSTVRK